ncbi:MAG: HAD-IIA family hydrolase [Phototrophicales bacterium]
MKFTKIKGVVLDMDGVLWRGDEPLPALVTLFEWFHEANIPFVLATNNSSKTPTDYVNKLTRMGVTGVSESAIITSSIATAAYLQAHYPAGTVIYPFGMHGLRQALIEAGFDVESDEPPDVVVAGVKFDVTYDDLRRATLAIRQGAAFIGTNPDKTFPTPEGLVPGAGSFIALLEAATDVQATIIGKPYPPMFEAALKILGTSPDETLMVGDRLNTDILGGQQAGMKTALVFTGVTTPEDLLSTDIWADVAYDGLPELLRAWAGHEWYQGRLKAKRQTR